MHTAIEDFVADSSPSGESVVVYGKPLHMSTEVLVRKFLSDDLDSFLSYEARYSVGNFLIVQKSKSRMTVVTSPGYSGGYFCASSDKVTVSTTLDTILRSKGGDLAFDDLSLAFFTSRDALSNFRLLPFSSLFKDVSRLQPSAVLKCRKNKVQSYSSYLIPENPLEPPASLEAALDEVFSHTVRNLKESGRSGGVLFSGGADCLIFALYLREMMDPKDIRILTMHHTQHSITNGPMRAVPIMKYLGMKLEYGETDYLHSDVAADYSARCMQRDHTHARGPHVGCVEMGVSDTDVMTGQNMDSIMNVGMLITHKTLERGYFSPGMKGGQELQELRAFARNIAYTSVYAESKQVQKRFGHLLKDSSGGGDIDPDLGPLGIVRGMFSLRSPNIIMKEMKHVSRMDIFDREIGLYRDFTGPNGFKQQYVMDMSSHVSWNQLAHKRLSTLQLTNNSRVTLPANSGPMLSYFLGRKRNISTALAPKNELYALIHKKAGAKYSKLFENADASQWERHSDPHNSFARRFHYLLNGDGSNVLDLVKNEGIKDDIYGIYKKCSNLHLKGALLEGSGPVEMKLIFLELLLSNVRGAPIFS